MKTEVVKCTQKAVSVGNITIEGYQLEDGSYKASISQIAKAFNMQPVQAQRAFNSGGLQLPPKIALKPKRSKGSGGLQEGYFCSPEQIGVIVLYFAGLGNRDAYAFMIATQAETMQRRFDAAFGVKATEEDYLNFTEALYKRLREEHRIQYKPLFTNWLKHDKPNASRWYYINNVYELKLACGLPKLLSVNEMSVGQLLHWNSTEVRYDSFRRAGLNHREAMAELAQVKEVTQA